MSSTAAARLFEDLGPRVPRRYRSVLTAEVNGKGVLDIDTVKGCAAGMQAYPNGGCYGECYAYKVAARYGIDFATSVSRRFSDREHTATVRRLMQAHPSTWYRVGTFGDPCHDWDNTITVCKALWWTNKRPVIISKHWTALTDDQLTRLKKAKPIMHVSISGLDTDEEIQHRLEQRERIAAYGLQSVLRVVTCQYGASEWARSCHEKQEHLLSLVPVIDNPLRPSRSNPRVLAGDIIAECNGASVGGGKFISLHNPDVHIGRCETCPDQCGCNNVEIPQEESMEEHSALWSDRIEFEYLPTVIGSGYEKFIAELALEDGIAHRAARKNMQIHSAVVLLVNDAFTGFMTFQNNHDLQEFCLLQSVIHPDHYTDALYLQMVTKVIEQNHEGYPAFMTTNPKSKFETPKLFNALGFDTYLKMGEFHYMCKGTPEQARMKILSHITMTNVWHSTKADWLRIKREWNERIEDAGEREDVPNPLLATREGCWGGTTSMANVVAGKSHNQNASVLDPVACEVIFRFFMPAAGRRVYNPFGGGVQFGFITGSYGYEYVASELRQNQCDANNKLCREFPGVKWVQSDSSTYEPEGMFDLVFSCPPYYKVEKYLDYDGKPPAGELNSMGSYQQFKDALFAGYTKAIEHLNDNCFFAIMVGDSRDSSGAYYCAEAETEMFLKNSGLSIYNRIVYLESEFTRLAQAKKTLNTRKFPKCEQKIIVAYKGDMSQIASLYPAVGRL